MTVRTYYVLTEYDEMDMVVDVQEFDDVEEAYKFATYTLWQDPHADFVLEVVQSMELAEIYMALTPTTISLTTEVA